MILAHATLDFSDIPNDGNEIVLLAVPAGMVLVSFWTDPATYVAWDVGPVILGQGPEFEANPHDQKGWVGELDGGPTDGETSAGFGNRYNRAGGVANSSILVPSGAGSIRAANASTATATAGHNDLYFLFDTPVVV